MKGFTTGMVAGTMIGVGMAILANPIDRHDMRRMKNRATKTARTFGRMIAG